MTEAVESSCVILTDALAAASEGKIEASFDSGVLTVHVPKAALPQPKKIHINFGSSAQGRVESGPRRAGSNDKTADNG